MKKYLLLLGMVSFNNLPMHIIIEKFRHSSDLLVIHNKTDIHKLVDILMSKIADADYFKWDAYIAQEIAKIVIAKNAVLVSAPDNAGKIAIEYINPHKSFLPETHEILTKSSFKQLFETQYPKLKKYRKKEKIEQLSYEKLTERYEELKYLDYCAWKNSITKIHEYSERNLVKPENAYLFKLSSSDQQSTL